MKPVLKARRASAAIYLRTEIERAEAEGVPRDAMTLKVTLSDVSQLKRDPAVPVEDISFADGIMRYLGVKIEAGGVPESVLERPTA